MHNRFAVKTDPRELLRRLIAARGFNSARALAIAAGISQPTLSRYLTGKSEDLDMPTWRLLAAALDVTIGELLGETPLMGDATSTYRRHLQVLESLPKEQQDAIMQTAKALAEQRKKSS